MVLDNENSLLLQDWNNFLGSHFTSNISFISLNFYPHYSQTVFHMTKQIRTLWIRLVQKYYLARLSFLDISLSSRICSACHLFRDSFRFHPCHFLFMSIISRSVMHTAKIAWIILIMNKLFKTAGDICQLQFYSYIKITVRLG